MPAFRPRARGGPLAPAPSAVPEQGFVPPERIGLPEPSEGGPIIRSPRELVGWSLAPPRRLLEASSPFACFLRSALWRDSVSAGVQGSPGRVATPWPCPPSYAWDAGTPPKSGRSQATWLVHAALQVVVSLMVVAMSYLATGQERCCLASARTGRPLSPLQLQACERLSVLVCVWSLGLFIPDDRGKMGLSSLADFVSKVPRTFCEQVVSRFAWIGRMS